MHKLASFFDPIATRRANLVTLLYIDNNPPFVFSYRGNTCYEWRGISSIFALAMMSPKYFSCVDFLMTVPCTSRSGQNGLSLPTCRCLHFGHEKISFFISVFMLTKVFVATEQTLLTALLYFISHSKTAISLVKWALYPSLIYAQTIRDVWWR